MSTRSASESPKGVAVNRIRSEKAALIGRYLQEMYDYIQKSPRVKAALEGLQDSSEVYEGAKKAIVSARYTGGLNLRVKDYGSSGGASVLGVFVNRFGAMAKSQGIVLNECALSVAQVATDIGGVGVGAVTFESGWGLLMLGINVASTYEDGKALGKACLPGTD